MQIHINDETGEFESVTADDLDQLVALQAAKIRFLMRRITEEGDYQIVAEFNARCLDNQDFRGF